MLVLSIVVYVKCFDIYMIISWDFWSIAIQTKGLLQLLCMLSCNHYTSTLPNYEFCGHYSGHTHMELPLGMKWEKRKSRHSPFLSSFKYYGAFLSSVIFSLSIFNCSFTFRDTFSITSHCGLYPHCLPREIQQFTCENIANLYSKHQFQTYQSCNSDKMNVVKSYIYLSFS